jgi:hypothetical protein
MRRQLETSNMAEAEATWLAQAAEDEGTPFPSPDSSEQVMKNKTTQRVITEKGVYSITV